MRLESFIVADAVSTPPDGKFYVLGGGVSKLTPVQMPAVFPLGIIVRFVLDEGEPLTEHRVALRLLDPDGEDMLQGRVELPVLVPAQLPEWVEGEQRIISATVNLGGVPITREGIHRLTLALDGDPVHELRIPVVLVAPTPDQEALLRSVEERAS